MTYYRIKSPSGKVHQVNADSFYSAIQAAMRMDQFAYPNSEYFKLNRS